ncbi:MAG: TerB family tellurite resistance protein [Saprospiraceae bacterium]
MVTKVDLFDAFGELIYALALADGVIQKEETAALTRILGDHPWASEIAWSFNYEKKKEKSLEAAFANALDTCKDYGASTDYPFLFEILDKIAAASDGVHEKEAALITKFKTELMAHFQENSGS